MIREHFDAAIATSPEPRGVVRSSSAPTLRFASIFGDQETRARPPAGVALPPERPAAPAIDQASRTIEAVAAHALTRAVATEARSDAISHRDPPKSRISHGADASFADHRPKAARSERRAGQSKRTSTDRTARNKRAEDLARTSHNDDRRGEAAAPSSSNRAIQTETTLPQALAAIDQSGQTLVHPETNDFPVAHLQPSTAVSPHHPATAGPPTALAASVAGLPGDLPSSGSYVRSGELSGGNAASASSLSAALSEVPVAQVGLAPMAQNEGNRPFPLRQGSPVAGSTPPVILPPVSAMPPASKSDSAPKVAAPVVTISAIDSEPPGNSNAVGGAVNARAFSGTTSPISPLDDLRATRVTSSAAPLAGAAAPALSIGSSSAAARSAPDIPFLTASAVSPASQVPSDPGISRPRFAAEMLAPEAREDVSLGAAGNAATAAKLSPKAPSLPADLPIAVVSRTAAAVATVSRAAAVQTSGSASTNMGQVRSSQYPAAVPARIALDTSPIRLAEPVMPAARHSASPSAAVTAIGRTLAADGSPLPEVMVDDSALVDASQRRSDVAGSPEVAGSVAVASEEEEVRGPTSAPAPARTVPPVTTVVDPVELTPSAQPKASGKAGPATSWTRIDGSTPLTMSVEDGASVDAVQRSPGLSASPVGRVPDAGPAIAAQDEAAEQRAPPTPADAAESSALVSQKAELTPVTQMMTALAALQALSAGDEAEIRAPLLSTATGSAARQRTGPAAAFPKNVVSSAPDAPEIPSVLVQRLSASSRFSLSAPSRLSSEDAGVRPSQASQSNAAPIPVQTIAAALGKSAAVTGEVPTPFAANPQPQVLAGASPGPDSAASTPPAPSPPPAAAPPVAATETIVPATRAPAAAGAAISSISAELAELTDDDAGQKSDGPELAALAAGAGIALATRPVSALAPGSAVGAALPGTAADAVARHLDLAQGNAWLDQLAGDIAESASAGTDAPLRFALAPERLGRLTVELATMTEGAALRLTTETREAHRVLTEVQPQLVAEARALGLRLTETRVDLGLSNQSSAHATGQGGEGGSRRFAEPHQPARAIPRPAARSRNPTHGPGHPGRTASDLYA